VLSHQPSGRGLHRRHVERATVCDDVVAVQRLGPERVLREPVRVAPPQRREAGVEPRWGDRDRPHADVGRQDAREPPTQGVGVALEGRQWDIGVHDLSAGVHAGIGATRAGHADLSQPQHGGQRALQLGLHGALARLDRPAREAGAVVGQVDADADEPAVPGVGVGGLGHVVRR
jgi:hypothetical protein